MFRVGQKVVCVKEFVRPITAGPNKGMTPKKRPLVGEIYTIYDFSPSGNLMFLELKFNEFGTLRAFTPKNFEPLKLDYDFVEEVIKQVKPQKVES